jgi:hypothetical protein
MNKETLSEYGWILISVVIISILLAFTTPFGDYLNVIMDKSTIAIAEQSVKDDSVNTHYFDCESGILTVNKKYKNINLIEDVKNIVENEGFSEKEQALCYCISDGNATTVYGLEEYLVSQGVETGTVDAYLVETYGLNFEELLALINGDTTYLLPENLLIPSEVNSMQVTGIGPYAFANLTNLKSVSIPSSVTSIHSFAFSHCESLKEVNFGDEIQLIDDEAFSYCHNLTSINIPSTISRIGRLAFGNCENLLSVKIYSAPENVNVAEDAFDGSYRITENEIKWIY